MADVDSEMRFYGCHDRVAGGAGELARGLLGGGTVSFVSCGIAAYDHISAAWLSSGREGRVIAFTYRRANLDMKPAYRIPIIHCIKRSHLVHAHRRHLQYPRHLVHDADAREAVLSLPKVQQRHHGRFLVLARVAAEDLGDELLILRVELEGDGWVVDG